MVSRALAADILIVLVNVELTFFLVIIVITTNIIIIIPISIPKYYFLT